MLFQNKKIVFIEIFIFFFLGLTVVHAQNFKPFRLLHSITTEHFEIIFPKESEVTAYTLASFADETYNNINALLGINLRKKIPVVITPDTEEFNGYMNSIPSPHIILFDTPMDLEWTSYEHSLRSLFLHELTHVFSLSSRSPFFETINRIFGGWVMPTALNASLFMVEGVTVSFESLNGFGRANDPLIKEKIRQAIYENKTLTPFQLSGTYDLPPNQSAYYEYGGLFSSYIQQQYGLEKYAEFWQLMGKEFSFSFRVYNSGLYRLFYKVYNISFNEAWNNFLHELALHDLTENPHSIPFESKQPFINVLAASSEFVYFGNQLDRELLRYNPTTKLVEKVMNMDSAVYDISISPDGKTMLLSSYSYKESLASAIVTEYDTSNGLKTGREWESFYRGQYFRNGIIGIGSSLHNNAIVYKSFAGDEEILLRGNEEIIFTTPYSINQNWIMYIRAVKGVRELCMFNYETKKEYILKSSLADDSLRWKYIRNLRVSNNKVMFVYNHDDRMYKLGVIDISNFTDEKSLMHTTFQSIDFSGGIFLPTHINGNIYYRGFFAEQDKLMQFPETIHTLSGIKTEIRLVSNNINSPENFHEENTNTIAHNKLDSSIYLSLSYMNPLNLWFPFPLIRSTEKFVSFDGLGIMSVMMDPTDTNTIILSALGDWKAKMANITIDWNTHYFGFPITLSFSDGVDVMYGSNSYRQTQASLSGSFTRSIGNEQNHVSIMSGILFSIHADNPFDDSSAYTWSYQNPEFSFILGTGWSNRYRYSWQLFGTGSNINLYYRTPFDFSQTRFDGTVDFAMEKTFPLRVQLYGAYDTKGMNMYGNSQQYDSYFQNISSVEYPSPDGLDAKWISGAQTELKLFGFEIQKNLSHIYFNRIYSTLAHRLVIYNDQNILQAEGSRVYHDILLTQSLILRLGCESTIIPINSVPIKLFPSIWGAWKISNVNDGKANDFYFNVGFEMSL